jgi:acyl-CoA synthetase (AMP-forming)/AMP-acid ligase II/thioesterase domain-containing protein/acyl carrier protein
MTNVILRGVSMQRREISEKIRDYSSLFPHKAAITKVSGHKASYSDFIKIYDTTKYYLNHIGINSYNRVALLSDESMGYALLGLAIMENAVYAPIDIEMNLERMSSILKLLKIDYILTNIRSGGHIDLARQMGLGIIEYQLSCENNDINLSLELLSSSRVSYGNERKSDSDVCLLATTSGTTSTPKVVPSQYQSKVSIIKSFLSYFGEDQNAFTISLAPKHVSNFIGNINTTMMAGGTIMVLDKFKHNELIEILEKYPITWFTASPAVLSSLSEYITNSNLDIKASQLRFIRASGAPLPLKSKLELESIFKTEVIQTYGMTEVGNISSTYKNPKGFKEGSVGISTGINIKILDDEILVKGPSVFGGYENPEETNDKYFIDGWFKTGDMGYIDEDGYIFITGRIKEMINKGGEKVSPYEVEKYILESSKILQAAVFPYPNDLGSEDVAAAIKLKEDYTFSLLEMRDFLSNKLSSYKMPSVLYIVGDIPISENGKVQRKKLYQLLEEEKSNLVIKKYDLIQASSEIDENDLTNTEIKLYQMWRKVLKNKNFGPNDDFFKLGGDSLASVSVLSEIEDTFSLRMPINTFFECRTIRALGGYIDNAVNKIENLKFLMPIKLSGSKTPLICLHTGDGQAVTYHNIGRFLDDDRPVYGFKFRMNKGDWIHPLSFDALGQVYADEIETLCPEGPYYVLGGCYGGILALKVAITLKERGKEVAAVIMLDSPVTGLAKKEGRKKNSNVYINKLRDTLVQLRLKEPAKLPALLTKKLRSFVSLTIETVRYRLYKLAVRNRLDWLVDLAGMEAALKYALHTYWQEKYEGKVYYFKATLGSNANNEREEYWGSYITELIVTPVETVHNDMQNEENSKYISGELAGMLDV